jgi:hypothetical protein
LRKITDIPEVQEVVQLDDGTRRLAQRSDYLPESQVVGTGPGAITANYFVLAPGISTFGTHLTNGDREQDYLEGSVNFTKRLANRWMARGSLTYSDWTWVVPNSYFDHHNPTNFGTGLGVSNFGGACCGDAADGNRDGEVVAEQSGGSGSKGDVLLNAKWSLNLNGLYQFAPERPWGFNVAANLTARQGYPNPRYVNVSGSDGIGYAVQVSSDVDSERNDDVFTLDLRLDKDVDFGDFGVTFSLDAFNVMNDNTVLQRDRNQGITSANFVRETVSPRILRFGVRLNLR